MASSSENTTSMNSKELVLKAKKAKPIETSDTAGLAALLKRHKISKDEYQRIQTSLGRLPSMTELGVFSAMWSEHCSYKSSRVHLKRFPTKGPNVVVGPGENAGVVRLEGQMCLAFKMESHNHPSYIEPYQGAATGVGGILRDVFCMGARPIANLNCLRFGERSHPRTEYIAKRAVRGIGDYGNCIGVPTVAGSVSYDKTYNGNCLVNAMTVGLIRDDKIFKGFASGIGNWVVYVGSETGRDGINGASMASDSFSAKNTEERSTVQVGDPYAEKLLLEATLEVLEKDLVIGIQDMGAAGLTSSSFEMAGRAGNGVFFDLDKVPLRAKNMSAYEIMLSESQERMLMVIEPHKWNALKEVLTRWGLSHAVIGHVTNTGRVEVVYQGVLEVDLAVAPLTDDAPVYERPVASQRALAPQSSKLDELVASLSVQEFSKNLFLSMLKDTGSPEPIFRQYDHHIGARTVLGPDKGGAGVLWIRSVETKTFPWLGVLVAAGCNERRVKNNPYTGGAEAVALCVRDIAAAGGAPLAVTDCLNFGSAEDPKVMREFSDAVDGITRACNEFSIPVVSGNVSLYNSTDGESIHPTPMIGVVGRMDDVRLATGAVAEASANLWCLKPKTSKPLWPASLAAKLLDVEASEGALAEISWQDERNAVKILNDLRPKKIFKAVRAVGQGGVGLAAVKMLVSGNKNLRKTSVAWVGGDSKDFFAEMNAAYVVEFSDVTGPSKDALALADGLGFEWRHVMKQDKADSSSVCLPFGVFEWTELLQVWNKAHAM